MKLSELNPSIAKKVLAYGPSGTGKTVFACSFPYPIYVADFDGKITSAASFYADDKERLTNIDYDNFLPKPGELGDRPFVRYNTKLCELETLARQAKFPYATVILDSLTLYTDQMLKEIVIQNPGIKRQSSPTVQVTALQDYMILSSHFKNMLTRLLALPANVVVTAHIQTSKDELTGEVLREPLLPGKLAAHLPIVFEEVYRTYAESKDGKSAAYYAQTQSDSRYNARSQIRHLPSPIKLAYSELSKFMGT